MARQQDKTTDASQTAQDPTTQDRTTEERKRGTARQTATKISTMIRKKETKKYELENHAIISILA